MMLTDFCSAGRQGVEGMAEVASMQGAEAIVEASGIQNAEAVAPANAVMAVDVDNRQADMETAPAETEAPETPAKTPDAPAETEADMHVEAEVSVNLDAEAQTPADKHGQSPDAGPQVSSVAERQERPRLAGLVVDIPQKVRPVLSNVTMRLTAEDKAAAQALAHERGMSLSEFCAALVAGAVRKARVAEKPAA